MEDAVLLQSLEDGLLTLTMNRPDRRNALTLVMLEQMLEAVQAAERDPNVRAIVLTGAGQAFCSGGDVKAMRRPAPACRWRSPATYASPRRDRSSPRRSARSACRAISAAATSCRGSSARPRRANSTC
jgi:2-(1,2-epoxy-1,2-dihydrophenyl)acetyl-CoA isomerase